MGSHRLSVARLGMRIAAVGALVIGAPYALAQSTTPVTSHAAAPAGDLTLVRQIVAQIATQSIVRADFTQTRTSALLATPSISHGSFVFARDRGVIWQVLQPQAQGFVYGKTRSARLDAQGNVASVDTQPAAMVRQVGEWTAAFASGDVSGLANVFAIEASGTPHGWKLVLTPTQPQIAQAMRQLTLRGDDLVRDVQLDTRRGDTVSWRFERYRAAAPLDAREQRVFKAVE